MRLAEGMKIFLETERLILRQFTEADADNLWQLDSDPEVMRYINGGTPSDRAQIQERLSQFLQYYQDWEGYGFWAVHDKLKGEFMGWFHFRPAWENREEIELGYRLKRAVWGQGYGTEGARALIEKGFFELGTKRVVAKALAVNLASIRVMEKAGLKFEKRFIETRFPGNNQEAVQYGLDRKGEGEREMGKWGKWDYRVLSSY